MKYLERKNFDFVSKALAENTFEVVKFSGSEAISKPYEFSVTLSAEDPDIDLKAVLRNPATLKIVREDEKIPIHGVPAVFEQLHEANHRVFYRAVLVPKLWYLGLYSENRLFLDKTVPQIIEEILKQAGLTAQDYELKFTRNYTPWEYICQYRESNLDFISRWMEREGIYYFFKQLDASEKLVITDSSTVHENIEGDSKISYSPASGLIPEDEEVVSAFVCRQRVLPKKVILKDYNYRKPSLEVQADADVDPSGREEVYIYGEHFKDPSQGKELATIRAQEFLCRETMYFGEGTAPRLAPGSLFELAEHYRSSCNRKFLVTEVEHRGIGTGLLLAGVEQNLSEREMQPGYSNHFVCIPFDVQFRPERKTPRPRFNGTMNAVVDAAGDGSTAELDDQGRYKVILPFDLSGRNGGKASRWIRMAQPYSGPNYGVHFPLHKGSEVLLTFIDGDLDRPIISGAVANPETRSPVTNANQTQSVIRDNFGNEIVMDATPGDEHIRFYSPHHNSSIVLGRSQDEHTDSDQYESRLGNKMEAIVGVKASAVAGANLDAVGGSSTEICMGLKYGGTFGGVQEMKIGYDWALSVGPKREIALEDKDSLSDENNIVGAKKILCLIGGADVVPKKKENQGQQIDNTSIIRADEQSITLTAGNKVSPILPGGGWWTFGAGISTALFAALTGTLVGFAADRARKGEKAWSWGGPAIGTTVIPAVCIAILWRLLSRTKKIEDIAGHAYPAGKIQIRSDGSIHINSKDDRHLGKYKKKIVIGVGREEEEDTFEKELRTKLAAEEAEAKLKGSRIQLQVQPPAPPDQNQKEDSRITLLADSVTIETGKPPQAAQPQEYSSNIKLQANGNIDINANNLINLTYIPQFRRGGLRNFGFF
jgi:type VI secretion system secreted protein VgrG